MEPNRVLTVHWKDHSQHLAQGLWNLFNKEYMVDTSVSFNGDSIKVHRLVLSVFIPFFTKMSPGSTINELQLDYVAKRKEDLNSLVEFVYTGKTSIAEDRIEHFSSLARDLDFKGFLSSIEECKQSTPNKNDIEADSCTLSEVQKDESVTDVVSSLEVKEPSTEVDTLLEKNAETSSREIGSEKCSVPLKKIDASKTNGVSFTCMKTTAKKKRIKRSNVAITKEKLPNSDITVTITSRTRSQSSASNRKKTSTTDESQKQSKHTSKEPDEVTTESSTQDDSVESLTNENRKKLRKQIYNRNYKRPPKVLLKCDDCEYETKNRLDFKRHTKQHKPDDLKCEKRRRKQYKPEELKCDKCNKQFKCRKNFLIHKRSSCGKEFQFVCNFCGHQTLRRESLEQHLAAQHRVDIKGNPIEENFKCTKCDFASLTRDKLRLHVLRKHTEKRFKCSQCEYAAILNSALVKHISLSHLKERNYVCDECGVTYMTRGALNDHIKVKHKGLRPYKCNECYKDFTCRNSYKIHMSKHYGTEELHTCPVCGYGSNKRYNLGIHMKKQHGLQMEPMKKVYAPRQDVTNETLENVSDTNNVIEIESVLDNNSLALEETTVALIAIEDNSLLYNV